jgi:hypothetical protein
MMVKRVIDAWALCPIGNLFVQIGDDNLYLVT